MLQISRPTAATVCADTVCLDGDVEVVGSEAVELSVVDMLSVTSVESSIVDRIASFIVCI